MNSDDKRLVFACFMSITFPLILGTLIIILIKQGRYEEAKQTVYTCSLPLLLFLVLLVDSLINFFRLRIFSDGEEYYVARTKRGAIKLWSKDTLESFEKQDSNDWYEVTEPLEIHIDGEGNVTDTPENWIKRFPRKGQIFHSW